ncbi:MAG: helix-turn-helix transcriptional regulator [Mycobacteriales bacterium]
MTAVSRRRNERLVNLVICLLASRRFLTASQIARTVPGYEHDESDPKAHASFQRRFERDKSELRELGVPVEVGTTSIFDTEPGYRIAPGDYALPPIELDPAAAAALGLAARLWQNASLSSAATSGLRKLRAAGALGEVVQPGEGVLSRTVELAPVARHEPTLESFLTAAREHRVARFSYRQTVQRASGESSVTPDRDDKLVWRELQVWGAVAWRGRWYVVGHDLHRNAPRCFRLSRVNSQVALIGKPDSYTVPDDVDLLSHVVRFAPVEHSHLACVRVPRHGGAGLRRYADSVTQEPGEGAAATDVLTLRYERCDWFATRLTSYGACVTVLEPPELREAVIARLRALADELPGGDNRELAGIGNEVSGSINEPR